MLLNQYPGMNAIRTGPIYLKPASMADHLTRCCRMVMHESDNPAHPLWRSGSATLVKYEGAQYVIATGHELSIKPGVTLPRDILSMVRISSGQARLSNIPLAQCFFETANHDQEYHDILLFKVGQEWENQSADAPYFFPIAPFSHARRLLSYMVGYPTFDTAMAEYIEAFFNGGTAPIRMQRAILKCDLDPNYTSSAEHVRGYRHAQPSIDGFSGGAVFSIVGSLDDMEAVLDGIIVRGGNGHAHIVDSDFLVRAIQHFTRE